MAFANKMRVLALLCICQGVSVAQEQAHEQGRVYLHHLNNGMTFCLSHQESKDDQLVIDLIVKFQDCWKSSDEKELSYLIQDLVSDLLTDLGDQISQTYQIDLLFEKPQAYDYPNIVLYKLKLRSPTQECLDVALLSVNQALEALTQVSFQEIELKLEKQLLKTHLTAYQVKKFTQSYYKPENMVLYVAGNLSQIDVSDSIKKHFSSLVSHFEYKKFNTNEIKLEFVDYVQSPDSNRWIISPYKIDPPEFKSFDDIILEEKEEKMIEKLMRSLASSSVPKLIWKQNELQKIGRSINHIHPLKFISHIINQPILRSDLQEIHRNYFKWRGFLDGFRKRMTEEFYKGSLKDLVPGFANSVDAKEEIIEHFIEKRDWEGLVKAVLY